MVAMSSPKSSRPIRAARPSGVRSGEKPPEVILFQQFFKSVGPRTYVAQIKQASNGNHYLILTEGRRDDKTGEVRKTRLLVFSEDFVPFFKLLHETAVHLREHPVPPEVRQARQRFWSRQQGKDKPASKPNSR